MGGKFDNVAARVRSSCEIWQARAQEKVDSGRNLYLFGSGEYGVFIHNHIFQQKHIKCFIDNDSARWGKKYSGLIVHSLERVLYEEPFALETVCPVGIKKPLILVTVANPAKAIQILTQCRRHNLDAELFCPGTMEPHIPISDFAFLSQLENKVEEVYPQGFLSPEQFTRGVLDYLATGEANAKLVRIFSTNLRLTSLLEEMNRRTAVTVNDFVDEHLSDCLFTIDQKRVVERYRDEILQLNGQILEFGVYQGSSIRWLANLFPEHIIHGFDSFEGLSEDWVHAAKGAFDCRGVLPEVPANVILHKGWFDESLPEWFKEHNNQPISLLRVDCDLYSSTKVVLDTLKPLIQKGTWILFDELIGYRGWEKHEYKALQEFLASTGHEFEYRAFGLCYVLGVVK